MVKQNRESSVELVITAPPPFGAELAYRAHCRMTLGALTELVAEASEYVVIAAPFLQPREGVSGEGPLSSALRAALKRGTHVDIVSTGQSLRGLDLASVEGSEILQLFQPRANAECEQFLGSHAKFCIADGRAAYVGSANLTGPGLTSQLEMGLLVRGQIASAVTDFWFYAVEVGLFVKVATPA